MFLGSFVVGSLVLDINLSCLRVERVLGIWVRQERLDRQKDLAESEGRRPGSRSKDVQTDRTHRADVGVKDEVLESNLGR